MKKLQLSILFLLLMNIELFANAVATLTAFKGQVDIQRAQSSLETITGMKLEEKDNIQTKENSKAQIIFKDETIISIGKNSNFSIEEYLYDDDSEPVAKFNMITGAMRTITGQIGKIAPQKFIVTTKTAVIGIRGTNFTIATRQSGMLEAYCTYGTITSTINNKVYEIKQGFFISVLPTGIVDIQEFTADTLKQMRKKNFGITSTKKGSTSKETKTQAGDKGNSKQVDSAFSDNSGSLTQSVAENNSDNILNQDNMVTLDSVIAQHSMSSAIYYGSYSTTLNTGSLSQNGDSKLEINFSNDTALLEMGSFNNDTPDIAYSFENVNSNTINGSQVGGSGIADGSFFGLNGNSVRGEFSYEEANEITANGIYSTKTYQELH